MATLRSRRRVVKPINEAKYFSSLSKDTKISTEAAPPVPNAAGTESDVNNTEQLTPDTEQQQTSLANLALEDSTEKISTEAAPPVPNAAGTESDVNNTEQLTPDTEQQQTSLANLALEDSTEKISTEAAPPVPNAAGTESDVNNTEQLTPDTEQQQTSLANLALEDSTEKISTEAAPPVPNAAGTESDVNNTEQLTPDTEQQQTSLANLALEDSTEKISTEAAPPVPNAAGTESDVNNTEQKRARRPVETTPGASDDGDSALEGTSQALHKNTDGKERVHSRREVRTHSGKKRARRPVETTPGASDDVDSALEGTRPLAWEKDPRRKQKRPWSPTEIAAVMRHFRVHIAKGSLATIKECKLCKIAEHPALAKRSEQNLRDFVRNRGIVAKKSFKDIRPVF
ncbi:uncharacterized protein LOC121719495 isoform X2 [Alosa sapidissima]|nr:uncharacterized protein LOC121719495 isoform X2 [Alosa sapidissima]